MNGTDAARRATYHHGDLRAALIAAGIEMLEDVGPERVSLRGIAARVGVSHTAPKNHFAGLRGLLTAIAAEGFRRHARAMTEALPQKASRRDRLRAAATGYVSFAQQNPALFRLMFNPGLPDLTDADLQEAGAQSYAVLAGIAKGLDWTALDGSMPTALQSETMIWSLVHGYATLAVSGGLKGEICDVITDVTAVMPWFDYTEDRETTDPDRPTA